MDPANWMTTSQTAARLALTPTRVRQLLTADRSAHVRTALGRLVDPADVERLAAEQGRRATPTDRGAV